MSNTQVSDTVESRKGLSGLPCHFLHNPPTWLITFPLFNNVLVITPLTSTYSQRLPCAWASGLEPAYTLEGKIQGFSLCFIMSTSMGCVREKKAIPYMSLKSGMFWGPGAPHKTNHQRSNTNRFSDLSTCQQLASRNLNLHEHEQNHSHQKKLQSSVNMGLDRFCSFITLLNQLENETIHHCTLERLVKKR